MTPLLDILRANYRAHQAFVAPARASAALWRFGLGLLFVVVAFVLLSIPIGLFVRFFCEMAGVGTAPLDGGLGETPVEMILFLALVAGLIPASMCAVWLVHSRSGLTLLGPMPIALRQFLQVLVAMCIVMAALAVIPPHSIGGAPIELRTDPVSWTAFLPVALLFVLLQSAGEEIAFRGYLQQQLAARFQSPLIWMWLPSALFAYGHYAPESYDSQAIAIGVAFSAGAFGLLMADLTARAGTLGPAIAIHFANNVMAMTVISVSGEFSGLALFTFDWDTSDTSAGMMLLAIDFMVTVIYWLVARLLIRR